MEPGLTLATRGAAPPTSASQGELGLQAAGKGFQACLNRDEPRDGLESGGRFCAGLDAGTGGMVPRPVHCGAAGPGRRETGQRHAGPPIRRITAESHPHNGVFGAVLPHARRGQWVRREPMLHAGWLRRPAPEIVARRRDWSRFGLVGK